MNGFNSISGPFTKNTNILTTLPESIQYISKLGIQYVGNFDLDLKETNAYSDIIQIRIGQIFTNSQTQQETTQEETIQLGKTRMLELQDVKIISIEFEQDMDDRTFINYQYVAADE